MSVSTSQPTVAIVLCTFNGARHIQDQLNSLTAQSWPIAIRMFDDASTDETVDLVEQFKSDLYKSNQRRAEQPQSEQHKTNLNLSIQVNAQNMGYVANFESGMAQVIEEGFDYIALCDQDDIWHADRVAKGMLALQELESRLGTDTAILAHSDLRMIDSQNECIHPSFLKYRHYEISNTRALATVLGQNGVMGNTTLMNRSLATMAHPFPHALHVHDYWLAVLAELHGHRILIDQALVDYRIHDANASNSTGNTKFGAARLLDGKSWSGFIERDFRLPFKEDFRLTVLDTLLEHRSNFPELDADQTQLLTTFRNYLEFKGSRLSLLHSMLKAGFFRKGVRHRLRLAFSTLLTQRYNS